jgi:hypothetical protein
MLRAEPNRRYRFVKDEVRFDATSLRVDSALAAPYFVSRLRRLAVRRGETLDRRATWEE